MWVWVLFVVILVVGALSRTSWFKGWYGEFVVSIAMKVFLDEKYHVINNVTLPTDDGTTQIDHIIVSRFGIFVVETKNMKGGIYGGAHNSKWTQALGGKKFGFQNPIRQNYKHTMTLAETLGVPHENMKPVVMFIGDAKLRTKDKMPDNVMDRGFCTFIKAHKEELLTEDEVAQVLAKIQERRLAPTFKTHRQHVRHVKDIVAQKELGATKPAPAIDATPAPVVVAVAPSCPKCGKEMVRRTSKKGPRRGEEFWGCSGFPACRGIMPVE